MILKSISYWAFPGGLEGTLSLDDFLTKASRYGFEAVELCIGRTGPLTPETTQQECRSILERAAAAGVKVASAASGLYWERSLASETAADREGAVSDLEKMIRIASWLKVRTLLTIPGAVSVFFLPEAPAVSYDVVRRRAVEGLKKVLPLAAECGVVLGLENVWNKFLLSPTEMADFLDGFGSDNIGAYVDVGNILPYGYPEQWLRILGHRVAGVHFKDFRAAVGTAEGFVDLLEGDVDWPAVMSALHDIGYDGPVVGEMIPLYRHYPEVRIANTSNAMDAILGR